MKKLIIRKCVATGQSSEKRLLFRVVRTPEGTVVVDLTGRQNGRGAYLLKTEEAIMLAQKNKALNRALAVDIPAEVYTKLLELVRA